MTISAWSKPSETDCKSFALDGYHPDHSPTTTDLDPGKIASDTHTIPSLGAWSVVGKDLNVKMKAKKRKGERKSNEMHKRFPK
jgi:hypothetical protein